ncbi:phosphogluconate dehydrogenase (NADP(+)-dependent, decarboxylating) [Limnohabitans sp. 2KL-1]|uniref:NADP-dependent phosphogluconate dehydrogenase n=1 Tax=Limnohabitans sp. 2KL-1 TaxID=1100699 RepID=UPI000D3BBB80|nr:NADP-dependent phosphogluconate dehydrogenase [Limnohabitans sp. 2KL-1]PUE51042.1 phosphogluconate dehydrogenase (NADP(+)-dependent, decarboxylating) [Limnohabitans sp. 2KL-1]
MQAMDIGLVGLGVMGENLALNLERNGFSVAGFDLDASKRENFAQRTRGLKAQAAATLAELVATLSLPRRLWLMVPAGAAVDRVLAQLTPLLSPGDVLIDGGNTLYTDTQRRIAALQGSGILYVGAGVSGGEEGALRGPALMPGGSPEAWPLVKPLLQAIAARAEDGQPCCEWMGPGGAGHFVKMVHNGIEYADMQMICEAYALMQSLGMAPAEIAAEFQNWSDGELGSYLIDITAKILARTDPETGAALVDVILDTAEQKGTGQWASQIALDLGVTAPTIAEAVFARTMSAIKTERVAASRWLSGPHMATVPERGAVLGPLRRALLAAKICAYAQGFAILRAADRDNQWHLPMAQVASVWRAGCIIRAHLLEDVRRAYAHQTDLANLLVDPHFARVMADCQQDLREVVAMAALRGVPMPAFMSALSYYDAYRSARLPANLLQAQRDYFGAHTYQRTDRPGKFHTRWGD